MHLCRCVRAVLFVRQKAATSFWMRGMLADWLDVERIEVLHCVPSVFRSLINQKLNRQLLRSVAVRRTGGRGIVTRGREALDGSVWRDGLSW